jgi:hypothetical protein
MLPVVDGLEDKYGDQVDLRRIEASGGEGLTVFQSYSLRGHPAYVLLLPSGEVVWTGMGELPTEVLDSQLQAALAKQ